MTLLTDYLQINLPAETIHHIFRFLDPQDLIRLQTVSKRFHILLADPAVWRTAYAIARLLLPPGPFLWQSTYFLQRTLIASARLTHTWTTKRPTFVSRESYTTPRSIKVDRYRWVSGRWLFRSKNMQELRVRDVETGKEQLLWDFAPYADWAATSVMNVLGHFIYVAVHLGRGRLGDQVKLLEFVVDDDTGELSTKQVIDVPTWCLAREAFAPCIRAKSSIAPYAYISLSPTNHPRHSLIYDPRTREFYKFPRFETQLDILLNYRGKWSPHLVEVHLTRTHLFVFSRSDLTHGHLGDIELIQTFALPDIDSRSPPKLAPASNSYVVRELRLSHEMYTRQKVYSWGTTEPLRDATVDPVTGSISLRFMHTYSSYASPDMHVRLVCAEYILPAYPDRSRLTPIVVPDTNPSVTTSSSISSAMKNDENILPDVMTMTATTKDLTDFDNIMRCPGPVLPITFRSHEILSIPGPWRGSLVHVSADGFVRGWCLLGYYTPDRIRISDDTIEVVHKFCVDATGERCRAVVGDPFPSPPWAGFSLTRQYEYGLDAMRGRIFYTKGNVLEQDGQRRVIDKDTLAVVVDFK